MISSKNFRALNSEDVGFIPNVVDYADTGEHVYTPVVGAAEGYDEDDYDEAEPFDVGKLTDSMKFCAERYGNYGQPIIPVLPCEQNEIRDVLLCHTKRRRQDADANRNLHGQL
jgi:hypothetical protein